MCILLRSLLILMIIILCGSCNEKISYSGKVLNKENIDFTKLKNKEEVINKLGRPNFIDPIEKKYYYFSEKKNIKNFFEQKISNRLVVVFNFNENETIKLISQYDLDDEKDIKNIKEITPNELIERGFLQKIFGGVGKTAPITSQ